MQQNTELRKKALDLLARREHSERELRRKLGARDFEDAAIEAALADLKRERLLSDERFTESYVNHRRNAGVGPLKILHELRHKGIDEALAGTYLQPEAEHWLQIMRQQRVRKYGEAIPDDYRERMKQARFLQNRGFSPESVMRLFR